jgi:hypothetical protein
MLEQRLAAKLGEHVDRMDSGVDEIVEDKIDDPVLASEGDRRLGAFPREGKKPSSFAAGEDDAQHSKVQRSLRGEGKFSFRDFILRQSPSQNSLPTRCHQTSRRGYLVLRTHYLRRRSIGIGCDRSHHYLQNKAPLQANVANRLMLVLVSIP